jgi:phosphoserine phosphatase RsbU/P
MSNITKRQIYWLAAGLIIVLLIILLYPYSTFNSLKMKITQSEAVSRARNFLEKEGFDVQGFKREILLDNSPIENRYILKKLGNKEYKEYVRDKKRSTFGWLVMFHQDLSRQLAQTTYWVNVSGEGNVYGFRREMPDTTAIPSLSKTDATAVMNASITERLGQEFKGFTLVESKEESYRKRTDFSFRWEKPEPKLGGKLIITGVVQGNKVGNFSYYFEVPQSDREYYGSIDAIYGTISAVFIVVLIMISFYLFLKKYHQGEVWVSLGRNLLIFYYITSFIGLVNILPELGFGTQMGNLSFTYVKLFIFVINAFIVYFFLALLIFACWTVSESYARSLWPEKLRGIDALIKGHLFTMSTGISLMRGLIVGAGLALSVIAGSILLNTPNTFAFISSISFQDCIGGWIPAVGAISGGLDAALLTSIAITFFTVNTTYHRWKRKWISVLMTGVVMTLGFAIAVTPPSLNNFGMNLLSHFLFGCFLAVLYFQFDLLFVASSLFYYTIIMKCIVLFSASHPFYAVNLAFLIAAILLVPVIYIISQIRKEEFVLENYGLPSHIQKISERERLKKELEIAAKVQLSLLPKEEPKIAGYEISAISIPAVEAGGDYFDFVKLSGNKIGIAIGDVSGKGVGAAIYMTLTKGILQAHAEEEISPKAVLAKVNRLLYKTIEKNSFVSMFYAILDTEKHLILYSRAGHNPGILCSEEGGSTRLLLSKGMALGLEEGHIFSSTLNEEEVPLKKGDVFLLYTDGFTEAMNEREELYGEERMIKLIKKSRDKSSKEIINLILKDVKHFVDNYPQHDDMTMLVVKRI